MTLIVRAAEPSGDAGEASGSAGASMRHVVAALGSGPEVGDRFTSFGDGFPAERWRTSLAASPRRGDVSAVAEAETRVIDDMRRRLDAVIRQADGRSEYWNLPDVLADRRAQCLGNCQLWYVLGHSVGLDVGAVEVSWPPDGELGEHETHVATLVKLADGRVQMIDTRYGIKSEPFRFGEVYRRDGAVWTLANLTTRRLLHRRVRLLDRAGIEGLIKRQVRNLVRGESKRRLLAALWQGSEGAGLEWFQQRDLAGEARPLPRVRCIFAALVDNPEVDVLPRRGSLLRDLPPRISAKQSIFNICL
jgi:hypothetical protein